MGKLPEALRPEITEVGGAKLVEIKMDSDTAVVETNVSVGSLHDPDELPCLAHALEHVVLAGNFANFVRWRRGLDRKTKTWVAGTDRHLTEYRLKNGPRSAPELIALQLRMGAKPAFDPAQVKRDLEIVKTEKNGEPDLTWEYLDDVFERMWFGEDAKRGGIRGSMNALDRVSLADLRSFHRQYYTSDNLTMVVAGDVRGAKVAFERGIEQWSRGRSDQVMAMSQGRESQLLIAKDYANTYMMLGVPGLPLGDERMVLLECIERILGGVGTSLAGSMLYHANRLYRGKTVGAYSLESVHATYPDAGYLAVKIAVRPGRERLAKEMIVSVLRNFRDQVSEDDLNLAKARMGEDLRDLSEDQWDIAETVGQSVAMRVPIVLPRQQAIQLNNIRLKDIKRLADELLGDVRGQLRIAALGKEDSLVALDG